METPLIFRFKFSEQFTSELEKFSLIHQYDTPKDFKEAFKKFKEDNQDMIIREKRELLWTGYKGDINDKMYRSARYYFKNKDHSKNNEKFKDKRKRRQYIKQNPEFINTVDEHMFKMKKNNIKPSDAFKHFQENEPYTTSYKNEFIRVGQYLDDEKDIVKKIKKTYKNRYFVTQSTKVVRKKA